MIQFPDRNKLAGHRNVIRSGSSFPLQLKGHCITGATKTTHVFSLTTAKQRRILQNLTITLPRAKMCLLYTVGEEQQGCVCVCGCLFFICACCSGDETVCRAGLQRGRATRVIINPLSNMLTTPTFLIYCVMSCHVLVHPDIGHKNVHELACKLK